MPVTPLSTFAVYLELGILLVEGECDGDELIVVVAVAIVARYHDACISDAHLGPSIPGDSIDTKQTLAPVQGENGDEVRDKGGSRGWYGGSDEGSQQGSDLKIRLETAGETRHTR